jgi:hypothetical protein
MQACLSGATHAGRPVRCHTCRDACQVPHMQAGLSGASTSEFVPAQHLWPPPAAGSSPPPLLMWLNGQVMRAQHTDQLDQELLYKVMMEMQGLQVGAGGRARGLAEAPTLAAVHQQHLALWLLNAGHSCTGLCGCHPVCCGLSPVLLHTSSTVHAPCHGTSPVMAAAAPVGDRPGCPNNTQ